MEKSTTSQMIYDCSHIATEFLINAISYSKNIKYEVLGRENIPKGKKPLIIASNHSGPVDICLFGKHLHYHSMDHMLIGTSVSAGIPPYKEVHFVNRKFNPKDVPFAEKYNKLTRQIPFSNKKGDYKKTREMTKQLLKENEIVAIFSGPAEDKEKRSKIPAKFARETGANILRVYIHISGKNGKKPESMFCKDTEKISVQYLPLIITSKFLKQNEGKNEGELVKLLTKEVWSFLQ